MDHTVTLNYGAKGFGPDKSPVAVRPGDTITFRLGEVKADAGPECKIAITLDKEQHFSTKKLKQNGHEDLVLTVVAQSADDLKEAAKATGVITSYACELFGKNGNLVTKADGKNGGDIVPGGVGAQN